MRISWSLHFSLNGLSFLVVPIQHKLNLIMEHALFFIHTFFYPHLDTGVCVAEHESNFNTGAFNEKNADGSSDYGLFQLNNKWWCKDNKYPSANACNKMCSSKDSIPSGARVEWGQVKQVPCWTHYSLTPAHWPVLWGLTIHKKRALSSRHTKTRFHRDPPAKMKRGRYTDPWLSLTVMGLHLSRRVILILTWTPPHHHSTNPHMLLKTH